MEFGPVAKGQQMGIDVLQWMGLLKRKHEATYLHCMRVSVVGGLLAAAFGLTRKEQEKTVLGCMLHDLGKIMIPTKILDAPVRLGEQEWRLMKLHPCIGAEVLAQIPAVPPEVMGAVRSHHERWDGRGYPDGLREDEIPLSARICCVADAFDSIVTERPYQRRKPADSAMLELQLHAGTQFDTAVVIRFGGILDQVRQIYSVIG
jgi:putative nucleotidyltransferase with HDIG domain